MASSVPQDAREMHDPGSSARRVPGLEVSREPALGAERIIDP